ncbi:glucose-specific PTS system EIIA component [Escherichia coli]|uniref:Glucose-specific PTS system EIIA component n=1 Tax=Escherichia coli TaxID=562 RepID=A0A377D1D2_ECOLX|nr:glucose-specific PTS system EIIA component [Escherichia coli]
MVAPVDGTIGKIFETNHAFSIESDTALNCSSTSVSTPLN